MFSMISFKKTLEISVLICFDNFLCIVLMNLLLPVFSSGVRWS